MKKHILKHVSLLLTASMLCTVVLTSEAHANTDGARGKIDVNFPGAASRYQTGNGTIPTKSFLTGVTVDTGTVSYSKSGTYGVSLTVNNGTDTWQKWNATKYSRSATGSGTIIGPVTPPSTMNYNSGGYTGTLHYTGKTYVPIANDYAPTVYSTFTIRDDNGFTMNGQPILPDGTLGPYETIARSDLGQSRSINEVRNGRHYVGTIPRVTEAVTSKFEWSYPGYRNVSRTTRYALFEGSVPSQGWDTRKYNTSYSGTVYMGGYDDMYRYKVSLHYEMDLSPPDIKLTPDKTKPTNQDVKISTVITDKGSGVNSSKSSTGKSLSNPNDYFYVEENGRYSVTSTDNVGNTRTEYINVTNIDKTIPIILVDGDTVNWRNTDLPLKVRLSPKQDYKEVVHFKVLEGKHGVGSFQNNGKVLSDRSHTVTKNGYYTYYVKDTADNEAVRVVNITNIDKIPPTITPKWDKTPTNEPVHVRLNAKDLESGIKDLRWVKGRVDENTVKSNGTKTGDILKIVENGAYTIYAIDVAGNSTITTITVDNISYETAKTPTFKDKKINGNVEVDIQYDTKWKKNYYRIYNSKNSEGKWQEYTGTLTITESSYIEAYTETDYGVKSEIGKHYVTVLGEESSETPGDGVQDKDLYYPDYRIPVQQGEMKDLGVKGDQRQYEISMYSDLQLLGKHTGYVGGYNFRDTLKDSYKKNNRLPDIARVLPSAKQDMKTYFESYYGNKFVDTIMNGDSNDYSKFMNYYIPLDSESDMEKGVDYSNIVVINGVGLNDVNVEFKQQYRFNNYLLGNGEEDVVLYEHRDTKLLSKEVDPSHVNTVVIKNKDIKKLHSMDKDRGKDNKIHVLRTRDREFITKVRELLQLDS